jgi:hypothetical protein
MSTARELWFTGLVALSLGCMRSISGDRASGDVGSPDGETKTTDDLGASGTGALHDEDATASGGTGDGAPVTTTAPPITCEDPYTACDGECTLLGADASNCGECGHDCKGFGTTKRCSNWECEAGIWPCIKREQGVDTCTEACASVGQICDDNAYCAGHVRVWMTHSANDEDPESTIEECERLVDGNTSFMQKCDDPIDWSYEISGQTVLGVACCCTQD